MRKLVMIGAALLIAGLGTVIAAPERAREAQDVSYLFRAGSDAQDGRSQGEPCASLCLPGGLRRKNCYLDEFDNCSVCRELPDTSCRLAPRSDTKD